MDINTNQQPQSPQPALEQIPVPPKPSVNSKTFLIVAVVFIVIIIGLITYIFAAKTKTTSQPPTISPTLSQPSPTPEPTADWKTYTEINTKFVLKYPKNWNELALPDKTGAYLTKVALTPQSPNMLNKDYSPQNEFEDEPNGLTIQVLNIQECINSADYVKKEIDEYLRLKDTLYPELEIKPLINEKISGYIIYKGSPGVEAQKGPEVLIFRCPKEIQMTFNPTGIENSEQLFDQILSTFKFSP